MASFIEFLKTGRFAGVGVGDTAAQVAARWGPPAHHRDVVAWGYNDWEIEVHFDLSRHPAADHPPGATPVAWSDRVWLLHFNLPRVSDRTGSPDLSLDGWPREDVRESHVRRLLRMTKTPWVDFGLADDPSERLYLFPSGVFLDFSHQYEAEGEREVGEASISKHGPLWLLSSGCNLTTPQTKRRVKAFLKKHHAPRIPR